MTRAISIFLASLLFLLALPAFAQNSLLPNQIQLSIAPGNPRPGALITVQAQSATIDLDRSRTVWSVGGKQIAAGTGIKTVQFSAGAAGTTAIVRLSATAPSGITFSAQGTIRPSAVDLIWQAESSTPPWYQGKALAGPNTRIAIAAVTTGGAGNTVLSPSTLTYTWKKGSTVLGDVSGRGKDRIVIQGPTIGGELVVGVEVVGQSGYVTAIKKVFVNRDQSSVVTKR